jgi:hypothetical protein
LAPRRSSLPRLGFLFAALVVSRNALAHGGDEEGSTESKAPGVRATVREESANPFRQSSITFDQSITTQTADVGTTPLSYVPLYELWVSFRPRYSFDEHWSLRGRFDYMKELTNSEPTTYYREDVFGDIWTELVYRTKLDRLWQWTRAEVGLRAIWPVSKISRANGTYITLGPRVTVDHKFQIRGEEAPWLNNLHLGVTFTYLHPFTKNTTATAYGSFAQPAGQDTDHPDDADEDGYGVTSDQISGQPLVEHVFWGILDSGIQITPRISFAADLIFLNYWHYPATGNVTISAVNPPAVVGPPLNDNVFSQNIWVLAALDYTPIDELTVGLGYYNLANALALDGQARTAFGGENIWWSPDARFFFDVSVNLDVLYDDARAAARRNTAARARLTGPGTVE